jgi:hypothetical protein
MKPAASSDSAGGRPLARLLAAASAKSSAPSIRPTFGCDRGVAAIGQRQPVDLTKLGRLQTGKRQSGFGDIGQVRTLSEGSLIGLSRHLDVQQPLVGILHGTNSQRDARYTHYASSRIGSADLHADRL